MQLGIEYMEICKTLAVLSRHMTHIPGSILTYPPVLQGLAFFPSALQ